MPFVFVRVRLARWSLLRESRPSLLGERGGTQTGRIALRRVKSGESLLRAYLGSVGLRIDETLNSPKGFDNV